MAKKKTKTEAERESTDKDRPHDEFEDGPAEAALLEEAQREVPDQHPVAAYRGDTQEGE